LKDKNQYDCGVTVFLFFSLLVYSLNAQILSIDEKYMQWY